MVPSLAVAGELRRRGNSALFIGTRRGMEARLAPAAGFPIEWIETGALNRVTLARKLRTFWQMPASIVRSWLILRRTSVAGVFSMGGYVAAPVLVAAVLRGVPIVAMEPNAMPGIVSRRMARFVYRSLVAFEAARAWFPPGRSELCGLPVREAFFQIEERPADAPLTVLLTGGSQGSRALNRAACDAWPRLKAALPELRWIHQSGSQELEALRGAFAESGLAGEVTAFVEDMASAYAAVDLVVGRSGAGAVAELAAAGRAALLVPFPFAADDHQRHNAQALVAGGAARMLEESELNGESLCAAVCELAQDRQRLIEMGRNARKLARPGAAKRAVDVLEAAAAASRMR